jgi:hypothetical protein
MNSLNSIIFLICFIPAQLFAQVAHIHSEKYYQDKIAQEIHGQTEVVLEDNTRIDIATDTEVIEVEFAHKWYEAIGQSAHYAIMTGKKPVIYLIKESDFDNICIERCKKDIRQGIGVIQNGQWTKIRVIVYVNQEKSK